MEQRPATPALLRLIWFALLVSTCVYAFVIWFLFAKRTVQPFEIVVRNSFTLVAYALSVVTFLVGTIVWNSMRGRPLQLRLVLSLAIFEAGAIFGLLAAFMAQDWRLYIPPWIVTVIGFVRSYPSDAVVTESANPNLVG